MTTQKTMLFQGSVLQIGDGESPEDFNTIAELTSFRIGGGQAQVIDASTTESTFREKLMGLPDEGQASVELNYDPSDTNGQTAMRAARDAQELKNFRVVFPNGSGMTFSAFVMSFDVGGAVDDKITANSTLEISGAITHVPSGLTP